MRRAISLTVTDGVSAEIINLAEDPQRSAFNAYRAAFRTNEAEPNLRNAVALVRAWNRFAATVDVEQHTVEAAQ